MICIVFQGCYPARLKRVFIISPPLWFKAILLILSSLLREKIRERIEIVSSEQLQLKLPLEIIPKALGGTLPVDHFSWLNKCLASYAETLGVNDVPDIPKTTDNGWGSTTGSRGWAGRQPQCELGAEEIINEVADFGEPVMSVSEFMLHMRGLGKRGIKAQYMELKSLPVEGVFDKTRLVRLCVRCLSPAILLYGNCLNSVKKVFHVKLLPPCCFILARMFFIPFIVSTNMTASFSFSSKYIIHVCKPIVHFLSIYFYFTKGCELISGKIDTLMCCA